MRKANKEAATAVPSSADPEASAQPKACPPMQSVQAFLRSATQISAESATSSKAPSSLDTNGVAPTQVNGLPNKAIEEPREQYADRAHSMLQSVPREGSRAAASSSIDPSQSQLGSVHVDSQQPFLAVCPPSHATSSPSHQAQAAGSTPHESMPIQATAPPAEPPLPASSSAGNGEVAENAASGQAAWTGVNLPKITTAASFTSDHAAVTDLSSPGQPCLGPTSPRFPTREHAVASSVAHFTAEAAQPGQPPVPVAFQAAPATTSGAPAEAAAEGAGPSQGAPARSAASSGVAPAPAASGTAASAEELEPHLRTARPPVGHVLELRQGRAQFDRLLQVSPGFFCVM